MNRGSLLKAGVAGILEYQQDTSMLYLLVIKALHLWLKLRISEISVTNSF